MIGNTKWRLVVSYVAVVFLAMSILGFVLSYYIEHHCASETRATLQAHATLLKDLIESKLVLSDTINDLGDACRQLAVQMDAIVIIRDAQGRVIARGDNRKAPLDADTQEPMRSVTDGLGCRICHDQARLSKAITVHVPFERQGRVVGVIELATSSYESQYTVGNVKRIVLAVLLITTIIAVFIGTRLVGGIGGPISHLNEMALKMTAGDLRQRVEANSGGEIGQLARSLNLMADRLHDNLNQLAQEKNKLEMILTTMADPIVVTDHDGGVTLFNPASERLFGIRQDRITGHALGDYDDLREVDSIVRQALEDGKTVRRELDVRTPARIELNAYASPVNDQDGNIAGVVVVLRDVTEYRRLVEMRKDFVANASHELRTPVASVRAIVGALQSGAVEDPDAAERFLGSLDSEIERLSQLLEDLLNLSELESGKKGLRKATVDLREIAQEAARDLQASAETCGLTVSVNVPRGLTAFLDRQQIKQVMINLLDNAVKYTPEGGSIKVFGKESGNLVTLSVRDTGVGIPMHDIDRIFERFYRVDKARSRMMGGTGLGLTIVQEIVEAHGGRVMVDSEVGQGSTFTVVLPKLQADSEPPGGLRPLW